MTDKTTNLSADTALHHEISIDQEDITKAITVMEEDNPPQYVSMINATTRNIVSPKRLEQLRSERKSVAMVGFSKRHCLQAPFEDKNIEIWALNRLHQQDWATRIDRLFQLHPIKYMRDCVGLSAGDREHFEWLKEKHDFPLYCQEAYEEFPSSIRYPIEKMRDKFGDFYTSTLAYMMALAIDEGYDHFELYGFDMSAETEYKHQRDSAEYFIGMAEGMGLKVYIPMNCQLLKNGLGMYGYETTEVGFRQMLEGRAMQLQHQKDNEGAKFNTMVGSRKVLEELVKTIPDLQAELDILLINLENQVHLISMVQGAVTECGECIKIFDEHYNALGIEVDVDSEDNDLEEPEKGTDDKED